MKRISYLDGHRGIAILLVIAFHAFASRPEIMPYGDAFGEFPLFKFGYLGVHLFFLISGFVIFMSLDNSKNAVSFIYRRWLRLFPAMLVCSLIIYATAGFFHERPKGQPELKDLITGLSFVEPYIWAKLTGLKLSSIEGAFWSLYVEFKFYLAAAIIYFTVGRKYLVVSVFLCFIMWLVSRYLSETLAIQSFSVFHTITHTLGFQYFGWFAAGAAYYSYLKTDNVKWYVTGIMISIISAIVEGGFNPIPSFAAVVVSMFFALSIVNQKLQALISNRLFLFFGVISYPLYLLHENMMISITIKLNHLVGIVPSFVYPLVAIALISPLALYIAKVIEPKVKGLLIKLFSSLNVFKTVRG